MKPERVFADTNLFLRYLTNDVPAQADAIEELLRQAAAHELVLVTHSLVIAEIVWTLESYYRLPKNRVQENVLALLNTPGLEVVDADLVLQAIISYADKNVDFIDAYSGAWLLAHDIQCTYTFDHQHFSRLPGVVVLTPGTAS